MKRSVKIALLMALNLCWSIFAEHKHIKHIIFDCGNVLFFNSKKLSASLLMKHYPVSTIARIIAMRIKHGEVNTRKRLFAFLNKLCGQQITHDGLMACDDRGVALPGILCEWVDGTVSSTQALEKIRQACASFPSRCNSKKEQALLNLCNFMLNPGYLARSMVPNNDIWNFINYLINKSKTVYQLYILSNYASDSFAALKKRFESFFRYFPAEHIFVSADQHCLKPHADCFEKFLKLYNLDPEECLFIDDQEENIIAAHKAKMHTIRYHGKDIALQAACFLN